MQRREPGQVHRDHHRPLAAELHPRAERHRDHRAHRRPRRGQRRHLGRAGVQHQDRDQRERVRSASQVPKALTAYAAHSHPNCRQAVVCQRPRTHRTTDPPIEASAAGIKQLRRRPQPRLCRRFGVDLDAVRTFVAAADAGQFQEPPPSCRSPSRPSPSASPRWRGTSACGCSPARRAAPSSPSTGRRSCPTPASCCGSRRAPSRPCGPAAARCAST